MLVVNQQLEDDNNNSASGGSTSSIDEIARVMNESKEVMKVVNQQSDDDNNHGEGGSISSIDIVLPSTSALTGAERELAIRLCKEDLLPIICADINTNQQKVLSVIKEKAGLDLLKDMTWNFGLAAYTSRSPVFQFQFLNGISTQVSTGNNIEGKDQKPLVVALVDQRSGQIVTSGAESATQVEIVVLEGDCTDVEAERWDSNEFNIKIIREWNGKKVLQGNTFVKLKEGVCFVNQISFTHDSSWRGKKNCRLGARSVDAVFATRVKEAITESFPVTDKRNLLYRKHEIPSLSDHVYRLNGISHGGACFKRLRKESIITVMDLRTLNAINPERLKDILRVHRNNWKIIMNHADLCKDDKGIYLYPNNSRDGVVFNVSGNLVGVVSDSLFLPCDQLSNNIKGDAEKMVVSASEDWKDVKPFKDEDSLINHLRSVNGLNLAIPHTNNNHTSLIAPIENDQWKNNNNIIVGVTLTPTDQSSQSPKRPASEHAFSNSPKRPRDDTDTHTHTHTDNDTHTEDEDIMQFLNFPQAPKWSTVWCVVGWISVFSKVRTPSTVTNLA